MNPDAPCTQTVVYMSRTPGAGGAARNGGRMILNEVELLAAIEALLKERGRGERLQVFNADDYEDFTRVVAFFSNEV